MIRFFIAAILLTSPITSASGQNLIGYKKEEIKNFMKMNQKEMNLNKVNNNTFIYLKYSDNSESQTILFFLGKDSVCRSIRIICDEVTKNMKIKEFDSTYRKNGSNRWIDSKNGTDYFIELREEDWASVITMLPAK